MGKKRCSLSQTLEFVNPGAAGFSGCCDVHLIRAGFEYDIGCSGQFSTITPRHQYAGNRYSMFIKDQNSAMIIHSQIHVTLDINTNAVSAIMSA